MPPRPPTSTLFPYTTLFRSEHLYGLDQARQAAMSVGFLAVVEGYTDVLMAHQLGVGEVVATMGTALNRSEEHTSELQSHSDLVCRLLLEKKKDIIQRYFPCVVLTSYALILYAFVSCHRDHQHLHSFPTRRSSDLSISTVWIKPGRRPCRWDSWPWWKDIPTS